MIKNLRARLKVADLDTIGLVSMGVGLGAFLLVAAIVLLSCGIADIYCRTTGKCKADQIRAKADITISSAPAEGGK